MTTEKAWYLYLIETAQGSLYTGITTDVEQRFQAHLDGKGAKYLRGKGPLTLVASQTVLDRSQASQLEYQVKRLTATEKRRVMQDKQLFQSFVSDCLDD